MKQYLIAIALALSLFVSASKVHAYDARVAQMEAVLTKYRSPMAPYAALLIATAEKYQLDWTLLAAIAGTESSFGRRMPANCINPYGWGIYGENKLCFTSFEAAIEGVAAGLAAKYNISSLESIARTYNTVSTEGWIQHTRFFMNKIKNAQVPVSALPITL